MSRYAGKNPKVIAVLRAMEKPVSELPPVHRPGGGTELSMLVTDPNTGEIYRRGGGQSVRQRQAMEKAVTPDTMKTYAQSDPMLRKAGNFLGMIDDAVQGGARRVILGKDQSTETDKGMLKNILAAPFAARPGSAQETAYKFTNDREGMAAMAASRALQTGVITAAGVGLNELTKALSNQTSGTLMPD